MNSVESIDTAVEDANVNITINKVNFKKYYETMNDNNY